MKSELPQPRFAPKTPASGWWKAPATLATDPVFLRISDQIRLEAIAVYISAVGWALVHNAEDGWIPEAALFYGQACPAPMDRLKIAATQLVTAGIISECSVDGIPGFVISGASKVVKERFARQEAASTAGKASAEAQTKSGRYGPQKVGKIDANRPTDWSNVSENL